MHQLTPTNKGVNLFSIIKAPTRDLLMRKCMFTGESFHFWMHQLTPTNKGVNLFSIIKAPIGGHMMRKYCMFSRELYYLFTSEHLDNLRQVEFLCGMLSE